MFFGYFLQLQKALKKDLPHANAVFLPQVSKMAQHKNPSLKTKELPLNMKKETREMKREYREMKKEYREMKKEKIFFEKEKRTDRRKNMKGRILIE